MQNLVLVWGIVTSFLFPNLANIKTDNNNNINILILGKSAELTDTIILASVNPQNKKISTISVPRDIWIPSLKTKINSLYFYGKDDLAKKTVAEVFDTQIDYSVVVDFSGFKNVIDVLGGIDVSIENDFIDKLYPVEGKENDKCITCRYETVEFKKGLMHMNGTTALKFVRSRHAEGPEGTDIAREQRQQKVVTALKDRITSPKTYFNIKKDIEIFKSVRSAILIDFDEKTASLIARKLIDSRGSVNSFIIPEELLIVPKNKSPYQNQYVFIPSLGNGKWEEIQKWYKNLQ